MLLGPSIQGLPHEDVGLGNVGEEEGDFGLIVGNGESVLDNLIHRSPERVLIQWFDTRKFVS